ncbi:GNAT family N-acetyltransferase [Bacillus sp. CECT 9360]|uniref:GNAT family N-acetyltransferase n=1 Tax=Bacillus sp. CECT 9360 TaxID=2845821 RepID=UPI001E5343B7|nr:GNAT family N-acetyltransferase [Bacillus sp. CECT 9360]
MAYRNELFVFDNEIPVLSVVRNYTEDDFDELIAIQAECFPPPFPEELWWNREQLQNHVDLFPEGALCIEIDGELAGSLTGLRVDFDPLHPAHTWEEITDGGYIRNHDPNGNTLYIVDISVKPKYRKFGLAKQMMQSMGHIVVEKKLDRLLGGGRMPGYHRYARELSPEQYVQKVLSGDLNDPVITFLLKCGRKPVGVLENYLKDKESLNYGTLMEWKNPFK